MIWLTGLVMAVVGLGVALTLLVVLAELAFRLVLGAALAAMGGALIGLLAASQGQDGLLSGVFASFVLLLPATVAVWRARDRSWARAPDNHAPAPPKRAMATPVAVEVQYGLHGEIALTKAWDAAMALAPRGVLEKPRASAARFLAAMEREHAPDAVAIDQALFIRRHVPAMVDEVTAVLADASPAERRERVAELVVDLTELGQVAESSLVALGGDAREKLAIRRARFAIQFERGRRAL